MTDEDRLLATQRIELLKSAQNLQTLDGPGWREIRSFESAWVSQCERDALKVDTSDPSKAIDALRRWQIATEWLTTRDGYIASTLNAARELTSSMTLEDALHMEGTRYEQSESSGDPAGSGTADPAGY